MNPKLSNDVWDRMMLRIEREHLCGPPAILDYSGPAPALREEPCYVCGRITASLDGLCRACSDQLDREDHPVHAGDWALPGSGSESSD